MNEVELITFEIILIINLNIIILLTNIFSSDYILSILSFIVFILFLIPLDNLIWKLKVNMLKYGLENYSFFRLIISFSMFLNLITGILLFIQIVYLSFL